MKWIDLIFLITYMTFGFRTLAGHVDQMTKDFPIYKTVMTKIGTFYVIAVLIILLMSEMTFMKITLLLVAMPLLVRLLGHWLLNTVISMRLRKDIEIFMARLHLNMRSGVSFRQSFQQIMESDRRFAHQLWKEIFNSVVFSQQKRIICRQSFVTEFVKELKNVDENSHSSLKRVEHLRQFLKIQSDFRRRSGQAMMQSRVQALVMAALYIAVFGFYLHRGFPEGFHLMIGASLLFFTAGFIMQWMLGRKINWNI